MATRVKYWSRFRASGSFMTLIFSLGAKISRHDPRSRDLYPNELVLPQIISRKYDLQRHMNSSPDHNLLHTSRRTQSQQCYISYNQSKYVSRISLVLASSHIRQGQPSMVRDHSSLPPASFGEAYNHSRTCTHKAGLIRKYGINMCRQCFREKAHDVGFQKVRFRHGWFERARLTRGYLQHR